MSASNVTSPIVVSNDRVLRSSKKEEDSPLFEYRKKRQEKKLARVKQGENLGKKRKEMIEAKKKSGKKLECKSQSKRAGLIFPVARFHNEMKKRFTKRRIEKKSGVMLVGCLEYLLAELVDLAARFAKDSKLKRITPRHVYLAIHTDQELGKLLSGVTIAEGGAMQFIHPSLLKPTKPTKQ